MLFLTGCGRDIPGTNQSGVSVVFEIQGNPTNEQIEATRARLLHLLVAQGFAGTVVLREGQNLRANIPYVFFVDVDMIMHAIGQPGELRMYVDDENVPFLRREHISRALLWQGDMTLIMVFYLFSPTRVGICLGKWSKGQHLM